MLSGNSLRQTVHTHCASICQAAKLVAALLRVVGVTAGLAESNCSLPQNHVDLGNRHTYCYRSPWRLVQSSFSYHVIRLLHQNENQVSTVAGESARRNRAVDRASRSVYHAKRPPLWSYAGNTFKFATIDVLCICVAKFSNSRVYGKSSTEK